MNNKDFSALAKRLLPSLPGFAVKGPMALLRPVDHILRAIYFEGSSSDARSFYIWAFILPLFIPTNLVSFTLGMRVRHIAGGDRWNADDPNLLAEISKALKSQALPFLEDIRSPGDAARTAKSLGPDNPYVQEATAYCLAKAGDIHQALGALDQLISMLDEGVTWQAEMAERARALRSKLVVDPADGQRQLDLWEAESITNLRLEEYANSSAA